MRLGSVGWVVGVSNPKRHMPSFHLQSELVEGTVVAGVAGNERLMQGDVALGRPTPSPDDGEAASVLDGGEDLLVQDGTVGEAVDTVGHGLADPVGQLTLVARAKRPSKFFRPIRMIPSL